jgi:hypothetical protein
MVSPKRHFLKINLEKDSQFCGDCLFCQQYEVTLDYANAFRLKKSAEAMHAYIHYQNTLIHFLGAIL